MMTGHYCNSCHHQQCCCHAPEPIQVIQVIEPPPPYQADDYEEIDLEPNAIIVQPAAPTPESHPIPPGRVFVQQLYGSALDRHLMAEKLRQKDTLRTIYLYLSLILSFLATSILVLGAVEFASKYYESSWLQNTVCNIWSSVVLFAFLAATWLRNHKFKMKRNSTVFDVQCALLLIAVLALSAATVINSMSAEELIRERHSEALHDAIDDFLEMALAEDDERLTILRQHYIHGTVDQSRFNEILKNLSDSSVAKPPVSLIQQQIEIKHEQFEKWRITSAYLYIGCAIATGIAMIFLLIFAYILIITERSFYKNMSERTRLDIKMKALQDHDEVIRLERIRQEALQEATERRKVELKRIQEFRSRPKAEQKKKFIRAGQNVALNNASEIGSRFSYSESRF